MKSKLVILIAFIGVLFIILYLTRSNSNVTDTNGPNPKTDTYNAKSQHMNDQPDHLFYFVQVSNFFL